MTSLPSTSILIDVRTLRSFLGEAFGAGRYANLKRFLRTKGLELGDFLGEGGFASVYEAEITQGPRAGDRVVVKWTSEEEGARYRKFREVWKTLPSKYRKHFVEIYGVIDDPETDRSFIVVEPLKPLSERLLKDLFGFREEERVRDVFSRPEVRQRVARGVFELYEVQAKLKVLSRHLSGDFGDVDVDDLTRRAQNLAGSYIERASGDEYLPDELLRRVRSSYFYEGARPSLRRMLSIVLSSLFQSLREVGMSEWNANDLLNTPNVLQSVWIELTRGLETIRPSYESEHGLPISGHETFGEALHFLATRGVKFEDIYSGNVMMRPSTGDVVVSDVGYFDYGGSL